MSDGRNPRTYHIEVLRTRALEELFSDASGDLAFGDSGPIGIRECRVFFDLVDSNTRSGVLVEHLPSDGRQSAGFEE